MHRFIYISTAQSEKETSSLSAIQSTSMFCNERDGLTGVLLWANGGFFQLIEGPKQKLDAAIGRIYLDTRHAGIIRMSYTPISDAICADWGMGMFPVKGSSPHSEIFDATDIQTVFERFTSTPDLEFDLFLRSFYETNTSH